MSYIFTTLEKCFKFICRKELLSN